MCYQEKRSIVSVCSTLLIFAFYYLTVYRMYQGRELDAAGALTFWGAAVLILIPVLIVAKIIIHVVFNIINKMATDEDEPSFTDELDKLIELKAIRNTHFVFMLGVLFSMGSLAFGMSALVMINGIFFAMITGCVVGDFSQLYYYRRGF